MSPSKKKFNSNIHLLYCLSGTNLLLLHQIVSIFSEICNGFNIFHSLNDDSVDFYYYIIQNHEHDFSCVAYT